MAGSTKRIAARIGVTAGVLVAVAGLTATSALAATTYTVKTATKTSGSTSYTGATAAGTADNPAIVFTDGTLTLGCNSGTAAGKITLGTAVGSSIGTITSTTWKKCVGPFGLVLKVTQSGTWSVKANGATSGGVTPASVGSVIAKVVSSPDATQCSFKVTGTAPGNYNNSTGRLTLVATTTGTKVLTVSNVVGCFGLINNNDIVGFASYYKITTPTGNVSVTSN